MNEDFLRNFAVEGKHLIETIYWCVSPAALSKNKLKFLAYDANLYPTPNFSTWGDEEFKQKQIDKALEFTKDFDGEVWLDDVRIKEKSE